MPPKQDNILEKRINKALDAELPNIYFNGFVTQLTQGDVLIILEKNTKPVAILNASYTVAKTLSIKLNEIVQKFEAKMGIQLVTTDDVDRKVKEVEKKNK